MPVPAVAVDEDGSGYDATLDRQTAIPDSDDVGWIG